MAKHHSLGPSGQRPKKVDPRALVAMTIRDLKITASNEKGKMRYLKGLDFVLNELYGVKKLGSKLVMGKPKDVSKVMSKVDLTGLIKLFCDRKDKEIFRSCIIIYHRVAEDDSLTDKETKKYLKKIKKTCAILRKAHGISKYKTEDDVTVKDLERYISNNEDYDYDDYDFDYDDEFDYDGSDIPASNIEKYLESVGASTGKRHEYDDSYDYPEFDDDDDYDEDDDDDNEIAEGFRQIGTALNGIVDRLEAIESRQESRQRTVPQQTVQPCHSHHQAVNNAGPIDGNIAALIGSINNLNKVVSNNNAAIGQLANNVDVIGGTVSSINEEIGEITHRVNALSEGYNMIIKDLYEEVDDDEDDDYDTDDIVISHNNGAVTIDDVTDAMSSDELIEPPAEVPEEKTAVRVNPTPIKDM